jgi:hypothetical protein
MYGFKFFTITFLAFINVIKIVHWKMFCILPRFHQMKSHLFDICGWWSKYLWCPILISNICRCVCVEPMSGQTKDYKFGISCFSAKHAVYTCMNSWIEPFNTYNSSIWIFSLFILLNWCQACFQSDTIVVSRRRSPYCLCWLYKKVHRVINGLKMQNSSSSYERIQNKQVTMLLSNQKARKRYTLIL